MPDQDSITPAQIAERALEELNREMELQERYEAASLYERSTDPELIEYMMRNHRFEPYARKHGKSVRIAVRDA